MEKYNGLMKVAWYVCDFMWGNSLSQILGLDVAWAIGNIAFVVVLIVLITIIISTYI